MLYNKGVHVRTMQPVLVTTCVEKPSLCSVIYCMRNPTKILHIRISIRIGQNLVLWIVQEIKLYMNFTHCFYDFQEMVY